MRRRYAELADGDIRIVQPTNLGNMCELQKHDPPDVLPDHAGPMETSVNLHLYPEFVQMQNLALPDAERFISPGVADSSAERGQEIVDSVVAFIVRMVTQAQQDLDL